MWPEFLFHYVCFPSSVCTTRGVWKDWPLCHESGSCYLPPTAWHHLHKAPGYTQDFVGDLDTTPPISSHLAFPSFLCPSLGTPLLRFIPQPCYRQNYLPLNEIIEQEKLGRNYEIVFFSFTISFQSLRRVGNNIEIYVPQYEICRQLARPQTHKPIWIFFIKLQYRRMN